VHLLDGFDLVCGGKPVPLPLSVQRLLAFLAFHDRPMQRVYVAGKLWLDTTEERAFANLRSTLWRAQRSANGVVTAANGQLALAATVNVDLREATLQARRFVDGSASAKEISLAGLPLGRELLPDWYDDWVLIERERHRQLALHALEAVADRLTALGRFGEAVEAAMAAIRIEPLRESAHRSVMRIHVAEGNASEALRHYEAYRRLLDETIGLEPSPRMAELISGAYAALTKR